MFKIMLVIIIYLAIGIYLFTTEATAELAQKCPSSIRQEVGLVAELTIYGKKEEREFACTQLDFGLNGHTIMSAVPDILLWLPHKLGVVEKQPLLAE